MVVLLAQAREASFETFVTGDKNLEFQQNLRSSGRIVVVLVAPTNKLEDLLHALPEPCKRLHAPCPAESSESRPNTEHL